MVHSKTTTVWWIRQRQNLEHPSWWNITASTDSARCVSAPQSLVLTVGLLTFVVRGCVRITPRHQKSNGRAHHRRDTQRARHSCSRRCFSSRLIACFHSRQKILRRSREGAYQRGKVNFRLQKVQQGVIFTHPPQREKEKRKQRNNSESTMQINDLCCSPIAQGEGNPLFPTSVPTNAISDLIIFTHKEQNQQR